MKVLRKIRSIGTFWIAKRTMDHLENIRKYELELVISKLPKSGKILEVGAGSGWQAKALEDLGYEVSAIDVTSSNYRTDRVWDVVEYDGVNIPFEDNEFDIVFSSNVFEHIPHVESFQDELHRVIKDDGIMLHVMPSSSWRFWTNITHLMRNWTIPRVHGEHAKNSLSEIAYFRQEWWTKLFSKTGWQIIEKSSNGLFYTGCSIMDSRISMSTRHFLSKILGSSCNVYVAKKKPSKIKAKANKLQYVQFFTFLDLAGECLGMI